MNQPLPRTSTEAVRVPTLPSSAATLASLLFCVETKILGSPDMRVYMNIISSPHRKESSLKPRNLLTHFPPTFVRREYQNGRDCIVIDAVIGSVVGGAVIREGPNSMYSICSKIAGDAEKRPELNNQVISRDFRLLTESEYNAAIAPTRTLKELAESEDSQEEKSSSQVCPSVIRTVEFGNSERLARSRKEPSFKVVESSRIVAGFDESRDDVKTVNATITLPGIRSASFIDISVIDRSVSVRASQDFVECQVEIPLPFPVQREPASAKFEKQTSTLHLVLIPQ